MQLRNLISRLIALGAALVGIAPSFAADQRPNIIVILADDIGYSDLGCYGGEIKTPNLDQLAAGGLRFSQFYNTARCCPTRASLLSGLYPHQAGVGHMMDDRGHDGYRGELNRRCITTAEALRTSGYGTYMVGKWHVTKYIQPHGPKNNWPLQRGFDRFYGTITGAGSFYDPGTLTRDNAMISPFNDPEYKPGTFYYTEALTDHAIRFVNEHHQQKSDQPFFLYAAFTSAHWPMHALEKDIAKYKDHYRDGYDPIREQRAKRTQELGLIDPNWKVNPTIGDWSTVKHKEWETRCMQVYAAMIDNMDQGIGRLVESLKKNGQLENTLLLYLQDNGGCQETIGRQQPMQRRPDRLPEIAADAIRTDIIPKQNRAGVPTKQGPDFMPGPEDTYIAYGLNWANVSNTPFREYKHFVHEGGISTPLIAHWPKGIVRHGEIEHQPGHLIDIMATCLDISRTKYPGEFNGESLRPIEGTSLQPAFRGQPLARSQPIYWEHEGNRAIRDGQWKLVAKEDANWELYDMTVDRTETKNVATENPKVVAELSQKWTTWAERANVLPLGTWRKAASKK